MAWAPGVEAVPIRVGPLATLRQLSDARGWGFSRPELERLRRHFTARGRDPTDVELAGIAQSWSEHCSYKSSRPFLARAFGRLRKDPRVLGTGDAGVMVLDRHLAYALRIESHNHPSAVEPYGGAATGIGGILRDVLAVGAKPVALADPLFFGPLDLPLAEVPRGVKRPGYLFEGVVAGIRDYGNRVGVPTVAGGIYFDPAYTVNPLVNVACVGLLPRRRLLPNRADRAGDLLVLVGGLTGRDGLGGVAFASRELTDRSEDESRGAVQLGNPIMKEPLIHACLEAFDDGLVRGLKDLGGGGLASASGELVHAGGFGSRIDLDCVPLREPGLLPWQIWISESQERMLLDVRPADLPRLRAIFRKHDVPLAVVGVVETGARERLFFGGRPVADLELSFRIEAPPAHRPLKARASPRPGRRDLRIADTGVVALVGELVLAADNVSRESIVRLYDHEVQGRTAVKPIQGAPGHGTHGDAAVLRPSPDGWRGLALAVAAQPWACRDDPRKGATWVVEEVARNLYAVGARPDAFTNCLNFGSPEDPKVLGDLAACVEGLADGAKAFGMAVPSGNVSLYNEGLGRAIPPTPVLLGTGLLDDLRRATTAELKEEGDRLYLVGRSRPELGGSLVARRAARAPLAVPSPDPRGARRLGERLLKLGPEGGLRAVHDVSDGGLGVTLCEMAFGGELGFAVDLSATGLPGPGLAAVAEGGSRWVVEVARDQGASFERAFRGLPCARLGETLTGPEGRFGFGPKELGAVDLDALYERWRQGLSAV